MKTEVDYAKVMKEVYDYDIKHPLIFKIKRLLGIDGFSERFRDVYRDVSMLQEIKSENIEYSEESFIKCPRTLNDISFVAMMELEAMTKVFDESTLVSGIATLIAIACYSENRSGRFDIDSARFDEFLATVYNQPLIDMLGIYNRIKTNWNQINLHWNKQFERVSSVDPDYVIAGGDMLSRFNIVNTLKMICRDFNITEKEAWQMPYGTVQTNSLEAATKAFVEKNMASIKERKLKQSRGGSQ